jgi:hypothetical protein
MASQKLLGRKPIVEKFFKIEMTLKVITDRTDGGPTESEVMEALSTKIHGKLLPQVANLDKPILQGKDWACINISGEIKEH